MGNGVSLIGVKIGKISMGVTTLLKFVSEVLDFIILGNKLDKKKTSYIENQAWLQSLSWYKLKHSS